VPAGCDGFCCNGCEAAFALIGGLGLDSYYRRRSIDPAVRPLRPEDAQHYDFSAHGRHGEDGCDELHLMVEGIHCAACVWLIETVLGRQKGVVWGRVNMTTRRLVVRWKAGESDAAAVLDPVLRLGYRLVPFDPARLSSETARHERDLLRAMAVAGFAAGNVMLFSVSIWAGSDMGPATRTFMHWLSALVALPAIAWCLRPFARSAKAALSMGRSNMDVPITIGVSLTAAMSLFETITWGEHAYFDSAITLLFFLLIGRYLDSRARGRARSAAEHLLALDATAVTVLEADGTRRLVPPDKVAPGSTVLVAAGERIAIDGTVDDGCSDVDTSLISGESVPAAVAPGARVFAGTINLSAPLKVVVAAVGERTLLAEIVRLMEVAEQGRARHVALADRVARWYAPVVHVAALATFLGWWAGVGAPWQEALLNAVAVLIITCPCALALAVPVVQVIGSGRLLRQGILIKSATALERLAEIDTVVFDKTGTLTAGHPRLEPGGWTPADLEQAAALALASKHPLARALAAACPSARLADAIREEPGRGLVAGPVRLGNAAFALPPCGGGSGWGDLTRGSAEKDLWGDLTRGERGKDFFAADESNGAQTRAPPTQPPPQGGRGDQEGPELWLSVPGRAPVRFGFADEPRADAAEVVAGLGRRGLAVELLSGDRAPVARAVAAAVGIENWRAACKPDAKVARLAELAAAGRKALMVGDGLNDAPALAAAHVSMSPSSAVDVSQTAADVVFQGARLAPVAETLEVARRSRRLVNQNFVLAIGYNVVIVPLAVLGHVTPLIAAIAMSSSSLIVICNALRLSGRRV
jgi:Cu2+-exporting ATPase